jgi:hypothetical protein
MKSKRREFLDMAERLYGWNLSYSRAQFEMWEMGIRDVRIHDNTFTIAQSLEAFMPMVEKEVA